MAMNGNSGYIYVSRAMGRTVKNMRGEELGDVKDLAVEAASGRVAYAIIKLGGGFMKSGKLYAVPWELLSLSKDETCLLLDFDKEMVANIPTFDEHSWPNMSDRHWGDSVYAFFGASPPWSRGESTQEQRETANVQ